MGGLGLLVVRGRVVAVFCLRRKSIPGSAYLRTSAEKAKALLPDYSALFIRLKLVFGACDGVGC